MSRTCSRVTSPTRKPAEYSSMRRARWLGLEVQEAEFDEAELIGMAEELDETADVLCVRLAGALAIAMERELLLESDDQPWRARWRRTRLGQVNVIAEQATEVSAYRARSTRGRAAPSGARGSSSRAGRSPGHESVACRSPGVGAGRRRL